MGVRVLSMAAQSVVAALFPCDCRLCGEPLIRISRLPVCGDCISGIHAISGPTCAICGERLVSAFDPACGACLAERPPFLRAMAYGAYEGGLRELVHLLKYDHVRPAASVLGRMLSEVIQELGGEFSTALVVPVPLHSSKLRQRGFNQAEEIARAALKVLRSSRLELAAGLLQRRRATESQTGLTPSQRRENVRGAFRVQSGEGLTGRDVLLVDDVLTTGTTAAECARILLRAGAGRVLVASVARALKPVAAAATPEPEMAMSARA